MQSFAEFESSFGVALQQERSDLQSLQGAPEAQLSAWVEHLFRGYLGYTHWKEIHREGTAGLGAKGSKQLFPDLRIDILDTGLIFVECKSLGRLDGSKGQQELIDAANQLKSYVRAHVDQSIVKPKTVLGVVTDGNKWLLLGLNRNNEFHTIAEWAFLTDDPRLLTQRLWLLAKPALAQPTSALLEFLARRTLAEVLKDDTKRLMKRVNERLPEGAVSEELIGRWLREVFSDTTATTRLPLPEQAAITMPVAIPAVQPIATATPVYPEENGVDQLARPIEVPVAPLEIPGQISEELNALLSTACDQLKPLLAMVPELELNRAKKSISIYAGKVLVGYASARKKGQPRLKIYVGGNCPEWTTPDPVNLAWCYVDDWTQHAEKTAGVLKEAARKRVDDMAAGLDIYRRRPETVSVPTVSHFEQMP